MSELPGSSLRGRLLRRLALLLTLILAFGGLSSYWSARRAADTAYDRTLLASARAVADGLYSSDGKLRANVPYVALDTFAYDSAGRIYYQVLDPHGGLVSGYEALPAAGPGAMNSPPSSWTRSPVSPKSPAIILIRSSLPNPNSRQPLSMKR